MSDATPPQRQPQKDASLLFEDLPRRQRRRLALHGLVWTLVTVAAITIVYFVEPLDRGMSGVTIFELTLLALAILGIIGWQIWRITQADFPTLRAVEALAFIVPAYLVFFAAIYYLMNPRQPCNVRDRLDPAGHPLSLGHGVHHSRLR